MKSRNQSRKTNRNRNSKQFEIPELSIGELITK
jgi:hypothetical protein